MNWLTVLKLVFVMTLLTLGSMYYMRQKGKDDVLLRLEILEMNCEAYLKDHPGMRLPADNRALMKMLMSPTKRDKAYMYLYLTDDRKELSGTGEFLDKWGRPIRVMYEEGRLKFASAGKDGVKGNKDDVSLLTEIGR